MNHPPNNYQDRKVRIDVRKVSKTFDISTKKNETTLFKLVSAFSGKNLHRKIKVLDSVSFSVRSGEVLGVVGRNGSGKSTLLRLIAGVYEKDEGEIAAEGNLVYIASFSQGLKDKLTMRENIFLVGAIFGLQYEDVRKIFDDIVNFSDLRDFVDAKVYQFSTGMVTRLTFSIAVHCLEFRKPDILLLDEVLSAGGDLQFKAKAHERIQKLVRSGASVVIVSHNMADIQKHAHAVLWLDKGAVKMVGSPEEILPLYGSHDSARPA